MRSYLHWLLLFNQKNTSMNEKSLKKYLSEMLKVAQQYQQRLLWSEDINISIDASTYNKKLFCVIYCHIYKNGELSDTVRFELSELSSIDEVGLQMEELTEFLLPYLP